MNITEEMLYAKAEEATKLYLDSIDSEYSDIPNHRFSYRFRRRIKKIINDQNRSPRVRKLIKYTRAAAIVLFVVLAGLLIATLSVDAAREQFIKIFRKITGRSTDYYYEIDNKYKDVDLTATEFEYLPKGFEKIFLDVSETEYIVQYSDSNGHEFSAEIIWDKDMLGTFSIDTENSMISYHDINGENAMLSEKDGECILIWTNKNVITTISGNIASNDILNIARNIEICYVEK